MRSVIFILLISLMLGQSYPVSDPGENIRAEQATEVTLYGGSSYSIGDGNSIVEYIWSVNGELKDKILESNPGLTFIESSAYDDYYDISTSSDTLTFMAPSKEFTESYTIYLKVVDSNGIESNQYGAETLFISEYSESNSGSDNRYIEIYNGTGQTISDTDWQEYEVWIANDGGAFMESDQAFRNKAVFWRDPVELDADHDLDLDDVYRLDPPDLQHGETLLIIKSSTGGNSDQDVREHNHVVWDRLTRLDGENGIALVKNGVPVDVIGDGNDCDCEWDVAGVFEATKNHQIVRKSSFATGNYRDEDGDGTAENLWYTSAGTDADDSEWIVLDPVCSNSNFTNEDDCEDRDGKECHRRASTYLTEDDCVLNGFKWDDPEWLSDNFGSTGSHDCTACKNFTTLTVEVFPVASIETSFTGGPECSNENFLTEESCEFAGHDWTIYGIIRSESFELIGSGDKDAEYTYDWDLILGSCFDGEVAQNIYNKEDCESASLVWKYYSWLNFCSNSSDDFITEQECLAANDSWAQKVCEGSTPNSAGYAGIEFIDGDATVIFSQDQCNSYPYCYWDTNEVSESLACKNIMSPDESALTVTSPRELATEAQEICFSLVINDQLFDSVPVIECVTVGNLIPVASAGEDDIYRYSAVLGNSISISASDSYDPNPSDLESLLYQWEEVSDNPSGLTLDGVNSETLVISDFPSELEANPTMYSFQLEVTDQNGLVSIADVVNIELAEFSAPTPPRLYIISYSDHVKLSWGFESEQSIDPLTKYADFEGYKLYRSEDGGETWCPPSDVVYDFDNNAVGCRPLIGWDLTEEQDEKHCMYSNGYESCEAVRGEEISGYDPAEPWIYLGDNSGVGHVYEDYGVVQGKEYAYTLTAFDMGLRTYELGYVATGQVSEYSGEEFEDCGLDTLCEGDDGYSAPDTGEGNNKYDEGELFEDCGLDDNCATIDDDGSQGNSVWDGDILYEQAEIWDSTNPDKWTTAGRLDQLSQIGEQATSLGSMENDYGAPGDLNYVDVIVGDLSSNVSDPKVWYEFVQPHPDNVGNGPHTFDIMDRALAENVVLKFEIQAEYSPRFAGSDLPANSFESNKTFNPTLYAWEVTKACSNSDFDNQIDCDEGGADWSGLYGIPVETGQEIAVEDLSDAELNYHRDFPGVYENGGILYYPNYLDGVEGKDIVYIDEDTETNWTDALYGTRFIFNNGYLGFANTTIDGKNRAMIQEFTTHEKEGIFDTNQILADAIKDEDAVREDNGNLYGALTIFENNDFELYYQNVSDFFDLRPPYEYMIEFSDTPKYKVDSMDDSSVCTTEEGYSRLPFRILNTTNPICGSGDACPDGFEEGDTLWVQLRHTDEGLVQGLGSEELAGADGARDCFWSRSENISFTDYVKTYDEPGIHLLGNDIGNLEPSYSYDLNLNFFLFSFFGGSESEWQSGIQYNKGDRVYYQSMNWRASNTIPNNIPPPTGSSLVNGATARNGFYDFGEDLKYDEEESGSGPANDPNGDNWYDCGSDGDCSSLDSDGTQGNGVWDEGEGTEGDGFNDNPWKPVYPWEGPHCHDVDGDRLESYVSESDCLEASQIWYSGDKLYFSPITWYRDGDSWSVDMAEIAYEDEVNETHFSNVRVIPNPYRAGSTFTDGKLHFEGLPSTCVIKIYTVTGKLVKTIVRNGNSAGLEEWDVRNDNGDKLAPGLYIYHIKSGANEFTGKFSIVR